MCLTRNARAALLHQLLTVADDDPQHGHLQVFRLGHRRCHRTQRRYHGHGVLQDARGFHLAHFLG